MGHSQSKNEMDYKAEEDVPRSSLARSASRFKRYSKELRKGGPHRVDSGYDSWASNNPVREEPKDVVHEPTSFSGRTLSTESAVQPSHDSLPSASESLRRLRRKRVQHFSLRGHNDVPDKSRQPERASSVFVPSQQRSSWSTISERRGTIPEETYSSYERISPILARRTSDSFEYRSAPTRSVRNDFPPDIDGSWELTDRLKVDDDEHLAYNSEPEQEPVDLYPPETPLPFEPARRTEPSTTFFEERTPSESSDRFYDFADTAAAQPPSPFNQNNPFFSLMHNPPFDPNTRSYQPPTQAGPSRKGKEPAHTIEPDSDLYQISAQDKINALIAEDIDRMYSRQFREDQDFALALTLQDEEYAETEARRIQQEMDAELFQPPTILHTCLICTDEKDLIDSFPPEVPTEKCNHSVNTCSECLQEWVKSELDSKGWDKISCPECKEVLRYAEVRAAIATDEELFSRYDRLSVRATVGAIGEFRWCTAANCNSGQIHDEEGDDPIFICHSCEHAICIKHDVEWHEGETCEEYDWRTSEKGSKEEELAASEAFIKNETRRCPNAACKAPIIKKDGCDHMKCTRCGSEFCYQCAAPYTEIRRVGNAAHTRSCIYHTDNVRVSRLRYPH